LYDSPSEGDGFEPSVPRGAARRCSARKRRQCEVARTSPPSRHDYRSNRSEASWVTNDPARLVVEIIGCRRSLQANSDLFSWRCRVARRPIRENAIRTQTGGTRGSPRDLAPASSRRPPNGHMGPFSLLHRSPDFQHFVDYGIAHTSLHRRSMPPVTAGSHGRRGGVVLGNSR